MKYQSRSFVSIRNDRRSGNAGRGKTQGLGLSPAEYRARNGSPAVHRALTTEHITKGYTGKLEIISIN